MATANTLETYLSPAEIAKTLGVHPSAPVRWCVRGAVLSDQSRIYLKHIRLPGGIRVRREDLDAFLETLTADQGKARGAADIATLRSRTSSKRVAKLNDELTAAGF